MSDAAMAVAECWLFVGVLGGGQAREVTEIYEEAEELELGPGMFVKGGHGGVGGVYNGRI